MPLVDVNLPVITWVRFLVWLDVGILIYWFYGRVHSPLADPAERMRRSLVESIGNFVLVVGALTLFNGFFITLIAYLTEFGVTSEITAKWHEIGVTPGCGRARFAGPWHRPRRVRCRHGLRAGGRHGSLNPSDRSGDIGV